MTASGGSVVRRAGRVLTGLGALVVLCVVLVGAPVALLTLAGNPLPDHLPTLAEVGETLTSRDDGRLFLRALAVAGWFGWATFSLSVLVELVAQALRRPAPRLPGMSRQQRAAAALVGSVALIVVASPAAASATTLAAGPYALPAPVTVTHATTVGPHTAYAAPLAQAGQSAQAAQAGAPGAAAPVYRVAKGDHLGAVAERYLDRFGDYRELADLNRIADPDRIHPGQLLRLPADADDHGVRPHATGRVVARPGGPAAERPAKPAPARPAPAPEVGTPQPATPAPPAAETPDKDSGTSTGRSSEDGGPVMTVGAAHPGDPDRVNRPLAISAVLAVSSIVGAQIGAVLGLRRRPGTARVGSGDGGHDVSGGRHRRG
ncbi:LysM peptidoglycan-binding domain-containing protein [Micromonospora endolithica]|uniref:LysM domain-containing protein n=1 Tax=Micromonospora endolithica TaxID=230091 RepID=A0A3A9ZLR1_9ACTN|nr:LysM domain-containing protein [Micromonospora endolithica]RKN48277.1 LysM domain-containing protein [Micromonospora endolithica]TWJ24669.1 LysM domain-containing protein [Micromonospora endolithica]